MTAALIFFSVACVIACISDLRTRRIPNALTYGALAIALLFAAERGPMPFLESFAAAAIVFVAGSILLAVGWLGGGDAKLLAAGAATIGFPSFLPVLAYIAIAGGLFAALTAARDRRLLTVLLHLTQSIISRSAIAANPNATRVPYAFAICAGTIYYAASESFAPWLQLVR